MKKLILTGKQIRLLLKVEGSGYGFYDNVTYFLEENKELPDEETAELEVGDDEFDDVTSMVNSYLEDDSHDEEWKPSGQEVTELKEFVTQLNPSEESSEGTTETEEKSPEDTTGTEEKK